MPYRNYAWQSKQISLDSLSQTSMETFNRCAEYADAAHLNNRWTISHTTALELLRIEVPRLEKSCSDTLNTPRVHHHKAYSLHKLHICFPLGSMRSRAEDVTMHLWSHPFAPIVISEGISCVPPLTAWAQMARYIDLNELVTPGDSMMRKNPRLKLATLRDFEQYVEMSSKFLGRENYRRALNLMAENTDSSQESRLRLLLQQHHLGRPSVNYEVFDPQNQNVYTLDLAYPLKHVAIEYDGEHHLENAEQRRDDVFKRERLRQLGWTVIIVRKEDLSQIDRQQLKLSEIFKALTH